MARTSIDKVGNQCRDFNVWVSGMLRVKKKHQKELADYLNMAPSGIVRRLDGSTDWSLPEFFGAQEFLGERFEHGKE